MMKGLTSIVVAFSKPNERVAFSKPNEKVAFSKPNEIICKFTY